jgi:hypothetical protein
LSVERGVCRLRGARIGCQLGGALVSWAGCARMLSVERGVVCQGGVERWCASMFQTQSLNDPTGHSRAAGCGGRCVPIGGRFD